MACFKPSRWVAVLKVHSLLSRIFKNCPTRRD
jgi:hypothetical protein